MNLGGANYTVDAACGSSLAAAALAVRELETGAADMVILGGVDTVQNPFTYLAFSKTQAFSPRGRCRPFDAGADGIVISEGVAALVLKRLADAERDGDRIYAVIKGVGASSDGRARGLTAPVVEGQIRALERAYAKAGVSPATVGYVEAHGTGTALGDVVEIEALGQLFRDAGADPRDCVVGSVKSLIGHTKCAAGLAGLINASLALYHKVLPPTIGIETPNPKLDLRDGPFRLCTQTQPWLHPARRPAAPGGRQRLRIRRHQLPRRPRGVRPQRWPPARVDAAATGRRSCWSGRRTQPASSSRRLDRLAQALDAGARPALRDLSHTLIRARANASAQTAEPRSRDPGDRGRLARGPAREADAGAGGDRRGPAEPRRSRAASSSRRRPAWAGEPVAFLFPGPGRAVARHAPGAGGRLSRRSAGRSRSSTARVAARRRPALWARSSSRRRPSTTPRGRKRGGR